MKVLFTFLGILLVSLKTSGGDFIYTDFNQTLGLVFNGNASTSACNKNQTYLSKRVPQREEQVIASVTNDGGYESSEDIMTIEGDETDDFVNEFHSQFGHRGHADLASPNTGCKRRLRLTSSSPSQAGSVFYEKRVPVTKGFDTTFTFQVTDHSRVCSDHVDPMASRTLHRSCAVLGGDGFAFVVHSDRNGANAIGGDGQELGYGGIENSLAIEFDTWTNTQQGSNDLFYDHISIHSASQGINTSNAKTMLGYWRPVDLADGKIHRTRVQYLPYIEEKYIVSMTANDKLLPYLKDNGEGRRLGTLAVFIDDGIDKNEPIVAIPLNLSILLDLPQSMAYVGFTASTGLKWENHDILEWHWCDSADCNNDKDELQGLERQ